MGAIDTNKIVSQYIYIHSSTPFFYESYFLICTQSKSCQIAMYFQAFCFGFSFLKIFLKRKNKLEDTFILCTHLYHPKENDNKPLLGKACFYHCMVI